MSRKRTSFECSKYKCSELVKLGGLCEEHAEEWRIKALLENAALAALHQGLVDGELPQNKTARQELEEIRKWWDRACNCINHKIQDPALEHEARFAVEWCQCLAEQIVLRERSSRSGASATDSLESTASWVWERFKNLEAGLMSNGLPRSAT